MKTIHKFTLTLTSLAALMLASSASAQNYGTDVLHLDRRALMTGSLEQGATGFVASSYKAQGKTEHQSLKIELSGLDTNGVYLLGALMGDDTNVVDFAALEPDAKGNVSLNYQTNGNSKSKGKGKAPLPAELNPVLAIREVVVLNTNLETVLTAELNDPDFLQYLVKRNLSVGDVKAMLQIHATTEKLQFRLTSSGLMATNDYLLVINGDIDQTVQADSKGKLAIKDLVNPPANALELESVALWDAGSNMVFSTELP
jgi:hypothetical protein